MNNLAFFAALTVACVATWFLVGELCCGAYYGG